MNAFDQIGHQYYDINYDYAMLEFNARSKGHTKKEQEASRKRDYNDRAYFLFMFTILEGKINSLSEDLIKNKIARNTKWSMHRPWEVLKNIKKNRRLSLLDKAALIIPRNSTMFSLILKYYKQRNKIAHGENFTIAIHMPSVISDFRSLDKQLSRK